MHFVRMAVVGTALACAGLPVAAQSPVADREAELRSVLYVSAYAEVRVAPDRAHLSVSVETRARTSQQAGTDNARIQTAVLEAVRRQGVDAAQLQTRAVQITPEYQYPREGGRPTVTGFVARNEVAVEVRDLTKIGALIDAALAAGATTVAGPHFSLANPDYARQQALDQAVQRAMSDARVMARAAGVRMGQVLEIASESGGTEVAEPSMARMRVAAADVAPTPVESGLITVRANVRLKVAVFP